MTVSVLERAPDFDMVGTADSTRIRYIYRERECVCVCGADHGRRGRAGGTAAIPTLRERQLNVPLTYQHNTLILPTEVAGII